MKFLLHRGVVDDVKVQEREDVACRDGAGANDGLGLVLEVVGFFDVGMDIGVGENVVEYVGLADRFAAWNLSVLGHMLGQTFKNQQRECSQILLEWGRSGISNERDSDAYLRQDSF